MAGYRRTAELHEPDAGGAIYQFAGATAATRAQTRAMSVCSSVKSRCLLADRESFARFHRPEPVAHPLARVALRNKGDLVATPKMTGVDADGMRRNICPRFG